MKFRSFLRRCLRPGNLVCALFLLVFVFFYFSVFAPVLVSGNSMDPTLTDGQLLVGFRVNNIPFWSFPEEM